MQLAWVVGRKRAVTMHTGAPAATACYEAYAGCGNVPLTAAQDAAKKEKAGVKQEAKEKEAKAKKVGVAARWRDAVAGWRLDGPSRWGLPLLIYSTWPSGFTPSHMRPQQLCPVPSGSITNPQRQAPAKSAKAPAKPTPKAKASTPKAAGGGTKVNNSRARCNPCLLQLSVLRFVPLVHTD